MHNIHTLYLVVYMLQCKEEQIGVLCLKFTKGDIYIKKN